MNRFQSKNLIKRQTAESMSDKGGSKLTIRSVYKIGEIYNSLSTIYFSWLF